MTYSDLFRAWATVLAAILAAILLSNGTGTRQQQIAEALRVDIEDYLTTH
ncbi:MAG TPA: hypothetical protein VE691_02080 [Rubrobacter sp.]|jgi:hypothetical protein|nr:hypothetical protein [Rubrobacter sp.]